MLMDSLDDLFRPMALRVGSQILDHQGAQEKGHREQQERVGMSLPGGSAPGQNLEKEGDHHADEGAHPRRQHYPLDDTDEQDGFFCQPLSHGDDSFVWFSQVFHYSGLDPRGWNERQAKEID